MLVRDLNVDLDKESVDLGGSCLSFVVALSDEHGLSGCPLPQKLWYRVATGDLDGASILLTMSCTFGKYCPRCSDVGTIIA